MHHSTHFADVGVDFAFTESANEHKNTKSTLVTIIFKGVHIYSVQVFFAIYHVIDLAEKEIIQIITDEIGAAEPAEKPQSSIDNKFQPTRMNIIQFTDTRISCTQSFLPIHVSQRHYINFHATFCLHKVINLEGQKSAAPSKCKSPIKVLHDSSLVSDTKYPLNQKLLRSSAWVYHE